MVSHKLQCKPFEGRDFVLFSVVSLAPVPGTLELNKSLLNGKQTNKNAPAIIFLNAFLSYSGSGIWEPLGILWGCHQMSAESAVIWRCSLDWLIWLLHGAAWVSSQHGDWCSFEWAKRARQMLQLLLWPNLENHTPYLYILLVTYARLDSLRGRGVSGYYTRSWTLRDENHCSGSQPS